MYHKDEASEAERKRCVLYNKGDLIVYGSTGVCRVEDVGPAKGSKDKSKLFYQLKPLFGSCVIYTPVEGGKVFMRPVISRSEANALIDSMPSLSTEAYHNRVISQLSGHYEEILKSHDCRQLAGMLVSLHHKKLELEQRKRKFGLVDERFMKRGEELLHGELSVALDVGVDEVPGYISQRLSAQAE